MIYSLSYRRVFGFSPETEVGQILGICEMAYLPLMFHLSSLFFNYFLNFYTVLAKIFCFFIDIKKIDMTYLLVAGDIDSLYIHINCMHCFKNSSTLD